MNEQQVIQSNDPHQTTHAGFYLHNLKTILFYSQFTGSSVPFPLREQRKHYAFVWKVYKVNLGKESNSEWEKVFFRDHFLVFCFLLLVIVVSQWIIMLKAGWHPHTASEVWHTKITQGAETPFGALNSPICLSPLGFFLLTQHLFPQFVSISLHENRNPFSSTKLLRQLPGWRWKKPALQELEQCQSLHWGKNVLPKCSCGHWPGPALAKVLWPSWASSVCVKFKLANILPHHILQQLNSSAEIGNFTIHFSSKTVPTPPQGASRVHANLSYLFKAHILKSKILMTDKWLAVFYCTSATSWLLLLFKFGWSSIHKEGLKMYLEKYLSPLPAPCMPTAASFCDLTEQQPKAHRSEG